MIGGVGKGIHAVLCVNRLGYIGAGNRLLYSFKKDIEHFRALTIGNAVVMGHGTFVSMDSKPLPKRFNIVLSEKQRSGVRNGVLWCNMVTDVLDEFGRSPFKNLYVIGGAGVLNSFLPFFDTLDFTMVDDDTIGDVRIDLDSIMPMFREEPSMRIDLGDQLDRNSGRELSLSINRYTRTDARRLY